MENCGARRNQTKYISFERFCGELFKNCAKCYGHLCQIYQNHAPNMVMSCDPGFKFQKF